MGKIDKNSVGIVETQTVRVLEKSIDLCCGKSLGPIDVAYESYGQLNESKDNCIMICHALTGSAHAAGFNSENDDKPGWWDNQIGPGKNIDTNKYFVICSNFLGSCYGTTGPASINPETGKEYGLDFPIITIADMVKVQKLLLDKLGIEKLLAVIGGSMGGMQALQWAIDYPGFAKAVIPVATSTHLGAQSIAFDAVGRNSILADENFNGGDYYGEDVPAHGLGIARMIAHITYLSEETMRGKFGRELRNSDKYSYEFDSEFSVETYLNYQGEKFVKRFDANSYLYITKAMDYFDLKREYGSLQKAFANTEGKFLVISFAGDWLFTPAQSEEIVRALAENEMDVSYYDIDSPYGHDAFLLETDKLGTLISTFVDATYADKYEKQDSNIKSKRLSLFEKGKRTRVDYEIIESLIAPNSKVLDVGCGDGSLLIKLLEDKQISASGIDLNYEDILSCLGKGIPTIQRDIERGLEKYEDKRFDIVILSQTMQTVTNPEKVFTELLRVGKKVIVSFPNFAYWKCRWQLFFGGHSPVTKQLPFRWYNSPNIHFLSLKDFDQFCDDIGAKVEKKIPMIKTSVSPVKFAPNLFAEQAVYVTSKD